VKSSKAKLNPREVVVLALVDAGYLRDDEIIRDATLAWMRGGAMPDRLRRVLDLPIALERRNIA
jgi:hypothetical protein